VQISKNTRSLLRHARLSAALRASARLALQPNRIARVLFAVEGETMRLLHGFIKKQQATPKRDHDLALGRLAKYRGAQ
jgi:phage-related protein